MQTIRLSDINLWQANYRQGDVAMIQASIQRFGYARGVSLWRDNTVIAGNHTIKALQALEAQQADVPTNVEVINGDWHIEVTDISHLDDNEATAYAIADNRTADSATNDDEQLALLLSQLQDTPDLLQATGWNEDDIAQMLYELNPTFDAEAEWEGMPEFEQENVEYFHSFKISFDTEDDMVEFAELVKQTITKNTTYLYYPKKVTPTFKDYQVINES